MVGQVAPGSAAEQAGFKANDVVVALNGKPVLHERAIFDWLVAHPGEPAILTVERDGERIDLTYVRPLPEVGSLVKGFPAENAGIRPGDVITSVDGVPASDAMWLTKYIREHKGGPLSFEVKRGEETFTIKVTPAVPEGESTPIIGVGWKGDGIAWDQMGRFTIDHPGPFEQVRDSVATILNTFDALFSPKTGVGAQHLSGPVMIFRIYYLMFESDQGWRLALWFSVILNINLAILNLLPFPVLDGGHITIALVEAIRRRPINVRVLEFVQTACAMLLIGYMLYVTFFDVGDIFGGNRMRFEKPATEQTEP
jgi:regulator of sigma E protease